MKIKNNLNYTNNRDVIEIDRRRDKIKILHFAKIVSRNDFVDSIISNIDPLTFKVYVVTLENASITFEPLFKEKGIFHYNLNIPNARNFLKIILALNKILRKHDIQVLHTHLFEEQFIGAFLKLMNPKLKFIIGRHYSDEIYLLHKGIKRSIWLSLENFANRIADRIIAGSQMVKEILIKQKIKTNKITSIPYGFDFNDYKYKKNSTDQTQDIRRELGINENELMLVSVGRLFKLKGQELLIEVFAELQKKYAHIKLIIVGDGAERINLENKVEFLQLHNKVLFTGWKKNAHAIVSASDIVVHPTLSEMFSQLMIESMSLGKPIIINDVSGVRDVITHKETGLICQHNQKDWCNAISLLVEDEDLRMNISKNAESYVKDTYPINKVIIKYEQLYKSLEKI